MLVYSVISYPKGQFTKEDINYHRVFSSIDKANEYVSQNIPDDEEPSTFIVELDKGEKNFISAAVAQKLREALFEAAESSDAIGSHAESYAYRVAAELIQDALDGEFDSMIERRK